MIPSLGIPINDLDLRNIVSLTCTEWSVQAGVSGSIYASNFLKSQSRERAAIVAA